VNQGRRQTAGISFDLRCEIPSVASVLEDCSIPVEGTNAPAMSIDIQMARAPFDTDGWDVLSRTARCRGGAAVIHDVCTSGFDLLMRFDTAPFRLAFRRRPSTPSRLGRLSPSRARLLVRSALIQFPAIWCAGVLGRAPLHASVVMAGADTVLLEGASGVGKSTLVELELAAGGRATSDNLVVSDGETAWGLVEPSRLEGGHGRRTTRGRRERPMGGRVPELVPDRVVVLRRGSSAEPDVRRCDPTEAARRLVTGTYMAGELRRFWPFAATLAAATGVGPAHPRVQDVAESITSRLPCVELFLPHVRGPALRDLLRTGIGVRA
jgi:hypothetical protein